MAFHESTRRPRRGIAERAITNPSSHSARPPTLWPPPRIAVSKSFARPKSTAATMSAAPEQRAMSRRAFVDAGIPNVPGVVVLSVRSLNELTVKVGFEGLEVHGATSISKSVSERRHREWFLEARCADPCRRISAQPSAVSCMLVRSPTVGKGARR